HRVDGPDFPAQPDGRHRYLFAPPDPFAPLPPLPASSHTSPNLDTGLRAVWGTLAARSNFSPNGTAPPGYLLAAAHAQGLAFVALADPISEETGRTGMADLTFSPRQEASVLVEAWAWGDLLGASAVVYAAPAQANLDQSGLLAHVRDRGVLQWLSANPPTDPAVVAIPGDDVAATGGWTALARQWAESGAAWLPAGNSNPTLPGEVDPAPHFSGLAVTQADQTGILQALAARRGWLTNRPGLWLTLRTDQAWMGTVLPPVEQLSGPLTFHIHYGDLADQPAGMTLWRNDRPLVTLDLPPADGRWSPTVPLAAGVYYVVATQPDGDFALTAPLVIPSTPPTPVPTPTITPTPGPTRLPENYGQAPGPPGSLAAAKLAGLDATVRFRAQIIAPPGLYNTSIYVAEPAAGASVGGLGVQVYLRRGDYPPLAEGDWVDIQGRLDSFRGELELILDSPEQIWRMGPGDPLAPLPVQPGEIGEALESRLVTLRGVITGWGWDSLYLAADPGADPETESVRVTVRSSLAWRRPYVNLGEVWQVTGIVSQFATAAPWNDGYRILVRYESDLVRIKK
ncbi:MAG: hypothetical protein KAZ38_06920, partial [Caldilineaceae bacterium]|nr:hypothetical protein [Caldilineaceae bacterium]